MSFQTAQRSARDQGPSSDNRFAAMVDSNTASASNDSRFQDTSTPPLAPSRRADDPPPAADTRSRDSSAASDNTTQSDFDDRTTATGQRDGDASGSVAKTGAVKSKSSKSEKTDDAKSKSSSSDDAAGSDPAKISQDSPVAATANAVATAMAPVTTATDAGSATAAQSDKATAPLATAAAAIVAATSAAASTGTPTPAGTDAGAAATATVAKAAGVKIDGQAAATETAVVQGTPTDATAANGIALAASTTPPVAPKAATAVKGPVVAKEGAASQGDTNSADGTTQTSASVAPTTIVPSVAQPNAVAGKPKTDDGAIDAVKTDASNKAAPDTLANAAANAHAAADTTLPPINSPDAGAQAANAIQPQLTSAATTPTPTTQLTVTAATHATVPLSGLAVEIAASAKSGKSRFEIRLDPAELGRIDVRIDVDRNGQVTSHLTVERPETLSMLRQDAPQLQRALDNAGLQTGNGGLQFSLRDQSSQGQNDGGQSNPNAHRLVVTEEETIPAAVAGRSYGRMLSASGGVDIRV